MHESRPRGRQSHFIRPVPPQQRKPSISVVERQTPLPCLPDLEAIGHPHIKREDGSDSVTSLELSSIPNGREVEVRDQQGFDCYSRIGRTGDTLQSP